MFFTTLYQESRISILEGEIELLEAKLLKNGSRISNGNSSSMENLQNKNNEKIEEELVEKVCKQ